MSTVKITNSIYSVGVLNPNLRIFDIVMTAEYGTSYNAYLIKGSSKSALVETVHLDFFDEYIENIKQAEKLENIEYLIMNHNEPDHSGSVKKLLEIIPNLKVISTKAGEIYLKNIVHAPVEYITAKDGDEISLGDKTMKFINAPFLHWPDSMFTYVKEEKTLFSCDFLGAHYCEANMLDTKMQPKYAVAYKAAMENYYLGIFSPFKPYVLQGLDKIKGLDIEFACTSHGPVLTKNNMLPYTMEKYAQWSAPNKNENPVIPIFYCSAYQNTEKLAFAIAKGITSALPNAVVSCHDLNFSDMPKMSALINSCDACLIGSPTINRDAVAPIWNLLAHVDAINFGKRPVALFGSYGWSGEALPNLRGRLEGLKAAVFEETYKVVFVPTDEDIKNAFEFGVRFAKSLKV